MSGRVKQMILLTVFPRLNPVETVEASMVAWPFRAGSCNIWVRNREAIADEKL